MQYSRSELLMEIIKLDPLKKEKSLSRYSTYVLILELIRIQKLKCQNNYKM